MAGHNRYTALIESIFLKKYKAGMEKIGFRREEIIAEASQLGIATPKNVGDVIYSFKFRQSLPQSILDTAPEGYEWVIRSVGTSQYEFGLTTMTNILPNDMIVQTKIPDATPGIIRKYAINDEQGLLAILRYNRLLDIFLGITCYSLQNHLRTTVSGIGQVETDEIYVGLDKRGAHYIVPVQAKGGSDKLGIPQIEQDFAICHDKFPQLIPRPVAAQFMDGDLIALFEFEDTPTGIGMVQEKHYRLVSPDELTFEELEVYRLRTE